MTLVYSWTISARKNKKKSERSFFLPSLVSLWWTKKGESGAEKHTAAESNRFSFLNTSKKTWWNRLSDFTVFVKLLHFQYLTTSEITRDAPTYLHYSLSLNKTAVTFVRLSCDIMHFKLESSSFYVARKQKQTKQNNQCIPRNDHLTIVSFGILKRF